MDRRALNALNGLTIPVPNLEFDAPVLVFGGCYSNLEATKAVRDMARCLDIPSERTICTGDIVAYGADAAATADLIRDWGIHVVMGNCEEALGWSSTDCGCGFTADSVCDRLASAWFSHADGEMDETTREWMRTLPSRIDISIGRKRIAVVHAAVDSINRFIFGSTPWTEKLRQIRASGCDGVFAGHSGLPFTQVIGGKLWHNSGSVGLPANDGTQRTWYSVVVPNERAIEIHTYPLDYDWALAAEKMRSAGLPAGYADALGRGLWPSCEILPPEERAATGKEISRGVILWSGEARAWPGPFPPLDQHSAKFRDPEICANGQKRAIVPFARFETLWFNTGTLCNLACEGCYIESSPQNDSLAYLSRADVQVYLTEAAELESRPGTIGFTGGEPFLNPDMLPMLEDSLSAGFSVLVLTNAMKPMQRFKAALSELNARFPRRLTFRVSLDHYECEKHERLRGAKSWRPAIEGLTWLAGAKFEITIAGRKVWNEHELDLRKGYDALFRRLALPINAHNPNQLILFPEMDSDANLPEISESCWGVLNKSPQSVMCASSRMVIKRRGSRHPTVAACTLIVNDAAFELGASLADAMRPIRLNHRFCAAFCVLGGASCS